MGISDELEGSIFDVAPRRGEIAAFSRPASDEERRRLETLRSEFVALHRHADTLLNNRLQGFIVGTSLLVGGYSQFREPKHALTALVLASCGLALAAAVLHVLWRTARAIEWYIGSIRTIEDVLYDADFKPYGSRSERQPGFAFRVSAILGVGLPAGAVLMWLILALLAVRLLTL